MSRTTRISLATTVLAAACLGGCASTHYNAMESPTFSYSESVQIDMGTGPGPSLVAGDSLAFKTVLAGGYDIGAPQADPFSRFANSPATTD